MVGQPREDVSNKVDAGMVTVLPAPGLAGGPYGITENSPGIGGTAETGDRFGAALSSSRQGLLAVVGVPGEDLGSIRDAGMVHAIPLEEFPIRDLDYVSQNSARVPGTAEAGDRFGASVQLYDAQLTNQCNPNGYAVGAPGEDIGTVANAGAVTTYVHRYPGGRCPSGFYHRGSNARPGDALGAALGLLPGDLGVAPSSLVVGSPGETIGSVPDAGVVEVVDPFDGFSNVESSYTLSTGSNTGTRYGSIIGKTAHCEFCD
jgi:hypothetical protein